MDGTPGTTNLLLGIMAAVSVIEALLLIAVAVGAYRIYAGAMRTMGECETRHIVPLAARVDATMATVDEILADVKAITGRVGERTERVVGVLNGARRAMGNLFKGRGGPAHGTQ